MLILAGVTINLTLGENGIFTTAQQVAKNYTDSQNKELSYLQGFTNEVDNIVNPAPIGTIIRTENGINYTADGDGNIIPVPVGFSPINNEEQGTKLTGFVIRNNTDGNEFVWIPVAGMSYTYNRCDFGKQSGSYSMYSETLPSDEKISVNTYGGYYIGRYEAGVKNGVLTSENNNDITDEIEKQNWTGWTGEDIKLVVQKEQQVWNYITRGKAITLSNNLYDKVKNNVKSKLCSSYAWDTALKFIETQNKDYITNSIGGYYEQTNSIATGNSTAHPCNIYDMGGNVWEWTSELCSDENFTCVVRGGAYTDKSLVRPVSYRGNDRSTKGNEYCAFRVALYL